VYTVLYDGQCRVCAASARLLRRWDTAGRLELVPYQDPAVPERFPTIPAAALREAMQVVGPDGARWEGAAAVERILSLLPAGGLLAWSFRVPVLGALLNRGYRWFARNRFRLGCGAHCAARAPR
jgi:predicted DCC family thiol-disulfide oxidoreductase YuxK